MALRCSLLGHDYGEAEVEREREERGSEVVVTVQEYEECARCGDRHVISENTEVTSISAETAADSLPNDTGLETEPRDSDAVEPPTADGAPAATEVDYDEGDVGTGVDTGTDAAFADSDDEATDEPDIPTDENGDPITDDGEILEDDDGDEPVDRDRDHGEWPDSDDVGPPVGAENEPAGWPDSESGADVDAGATGNDVDDADTEFVDADSDAEFIDADDGDEPVTDDAVVLEDDSGGAPESGAAADARAGTATSIDAESDQHSTGADPQATAESDDAAGTGIERAGSAPAPGQHDGPRDDTPSEFYCPRCEFVATGDRGSLRAGDICPDCRKGYLGKRERR